MNAAIATEPAPVNKAPESSCERGDGDPRKPGPERKIHSREADGHNVTRSDQAQEARFRRHARWGHAGSAARRRGRSWPVGPEPTVERHRGCTASRRNRRAAAPCRSKVAPIVVSPGSPALVEKSATYSARLDATRTTGERPRAWARRAAHQHRRCRPCCMPAGVGMRRRMRWASLLIAFPSFGCVNSARVLSRLRPMSPHRSGRTAPAFDDLVLRDERSRRSV
ncbi:hypothetical protein MCHLDSM_05709 [Mycolicibacterium chlorophenolicum]|uniref:Uncharacterized protein n=1 Tax=Mycolicibacterium chlorophenolicum TaxID=37916 RepID=A0A0J6YDA1_9MYCO|nr:hypothetical protein MCHLDSM_05709 [Mycolicibacterium chlorophenolicum]